MIVAIPKPTTHRDSKYRRWVKSRPCMIDNKDCRLPIDPHHVIQEGHGKTGKKNDDFNCVNLCRAHHNEAEDVLGNKRFEIKYGVDFELAIRQLRELYYFELAAKRWNAEHPSPRPKKPREVKTVKTFAQCIYCKKLHRIKGQRFWCCKVRQYYELGFSVLPPTGE